MRRGLVLLVAATLSVAVVVGVLISNVLVAAHQSAHADSVSCVATLGPAGDPNGADGQQQAAQLNPRQRDVAGQIVGIGQQRQLPPRAWQIALQAGQTESHLTNLQGGDRDSLGVFQMRPSQNWGTAAQVTNVDYATNKFFDVLLSVDGWEQIRPGDAAQQVERSGFPFRYHQWEALAVSLVGGAGISDASGCGPATGGQAPNPTAGQAVQAALSVQGAPYVWGAKGPDAFDCSGLMHWAWQQAGVAIPGGSWMQYNAGKRVPTDQAAPGDLVFWASDPADPESIHHVGMITDQDTVVQAPDTGKPVQVTPLHSPLTRSDELLPMAVRPGT